MVTTNDSTINVRRFVHERVQASATTDETLQSVYEALHAMISEGVPVDSNLNIRADDAGYVIRSDWSAEKDA
jgi:hypothetical protein